MYNQYTMKYTYYCIYSQQYNSCYEIKRVVEAGLLLLVDHSKWDVEYLDTLWLKLLLNVLKVVLELRKRNKDYVFDTVCTDSSLKTVFEY